MFRHNKLLFFIAAVLLSTCLVRLPAQGSDYEPPVSKHTSLTVLNYIAGWSHDALGYHPAVYLLLENTSGHDLSNKLIRFQARFTDMQTAEVTVGRKEIRKEFKPNQQVRVAIEGPRPYELPFEVYHWPNIECKVMSRIGNMGDEGTETLMISKLESLTHTTDDAFQALNQSSGFNPNKHHTAHATKTTQAVKSPERKEVAPVPLVATAAKFKPDVPPHAEPQSASPLAMLASKGTPGLGDDFYNFEQRFGLPVDFDAKHTDFTWAQYRHPQSGTEIVAGSRERTGKVDLIVLRLPRSSAYDEFAIINASKPLAGKLKAQPLGTPKKSVRYLPSGRLELVSAIASGYKVACMSPKNETPDNGFILVVSRLPQEMDPLLAGLSHKSHLLKRLKFLETKEAEAASAP